MTDNIIKFGKAKKSLARKAKEKKAAINRTRFGQKKSAKELKKALAEKLQANLDGHKLTPEKDDD
ncbi:DUF4169 family protein [Litorimonas sp. RW-G-Af-16]|uniref:DUF4169 family protein n=1 Tax=Litorimonas sp. RW-G-Af-16 TaxID=3241168 RepID=UPI00390C62F0